MHLLSRIGCTCYYFDTMLLKILTWMHSSLDILLYMSSYYTCQHVCIRNVLCHIHGYRIDRGNNVAGIQRRRGTGLAWDSSSRSSQRRGAEPRTTFRVPWSSPHFLSKRQAPEHSKSPSILQNITQVLMIDALGYKSWLEPLMHINSLSRKVPLTLYRSRIQYMLSHA